MVSKEEWRWLRIAGLLIILFTTIPYLAGYFQQSDDWRFSGFLLGLEDGNSYIAKMLTGTYGSWLFRSPYSVMPQTGVVAFLPYILLGKLAYPPEAHDQLVALFHIFRFFAGGFLIWVTYLFCSKFIEKVVYRRLASLMILLGGGLGWTGLILTGGNTGWGGSLEFYSPEAFGFLSLLGLPHLIMARGLLLLGFVYFLKSLEKEKSWENSVKGGICWFFIGFFQPLTIVIGYGVLGCYLLIQLILTEKQKWGSVLRYAGNGAIMAGISSPWVLYNFLFFNSDPYLKAWYGQNIISSPPVVDYLLSFGVFLVVGIPGLVQIFKMQSKEYFILPAWILCAGILAYAPYNLQRRFIDGIWVAIVILIFFSLESILRKPACRLIARVVISLSFISPILILMVVLMGILKPAEPVFRSANEIKMVNTLEKQVSPGDVIVSDYKTANSLPAWIPVRVIAGHGPESVNLKNELSNIERFFSDQNDEQWQRDFIKINQIRFIVITPETTRLYGWHLADGLPLQKIYDSGDYKVYRVEMNNAP
jgi:hypothetical protein